MRYWVQLHGAVPPERAGAAGGEVERGLDALNVGAIGHATAKLGVGTGVTAPVFRHNPAVVARLRQPWRSSAPPARLQAGFSWAEDDEAALEGARVWKSTQIPDYFTDGWDDPRDVRAGRAGGIRRRVQGGLHRVAGSGAAPEQALEGTAIGVLPALRG